MSVPTIDDRTSLILHELDLELPPECDFNGEWEMSNRTRMSLAASLRVRAERIEWTG